MSSLVVVTVADRSESLRAELALVRFLTGMDADVYLEVASLVKLLVAEFGLASFGVSANHLCADEVLVLLFLIFLMVVLSFDALSEILLYKAVVILSILLFKVKIFILVDVGDTEVGQVVV